MTSLPFRFKPIKQPDLVVKYAAMFSAIGTEARLRILRLLLKAHPEGLLAREIQEELSIPSSALSNHLDKLKSEDLIHIRRESTSFRYTANTEGLQGLLEFLVAECCTRSNVVHSETIIQICK